MKEWLKFILIFLGGTGFYLLTGDLSEAILAIVVLSYIELRIHWK
jgi:hypothetical protein